jgi:hypothetical protein
MPDILVIPSADDQDDLTNAFVKLGVTLPLTNQNAVSWGLTLGTAYKTRVLGTAGDLLVADNTPAAGATVKALGTAAQNFTTSLAVPVPATDAGDIILIIAWAPNAAAPANPTNFDLVSTLGGGGGGDMWLWKWNGTGTRPNSSNVTISLTNSNIRAQAIVCTGSATGTPGTKAASGATTHQSASLTVTANSIVLHFVSLREDVSFTTSYTGTTPDETTLSPPDNAGRIAGWRAVAVGGIYQVIPEASSGSANRMTVSASFFTASILSVEVLA